MPAHRDLDAWKTFAASVVEMEGRTAVGVLRYERVGRRWCEGLRG